MTDHSAVGRRSVRKGKKNERLLMKRFTEWWGTEVRRTPSSGAYGGDWDLSGDLMFRPTDPFPFHVEAKDRENWRLEQLLTPGTPGPVLQSWWEQARGEAESAGKRPLLIFSRNFVPHFVILRHGDYLALRAEPRIPDGGLGFWDPMRIELMWGEHKLVVTTLEEFLRLPAARVRHLVPKVGMRYSGGGGQEIDFR